MTAPAEPSIDRTRHYAETRKPTIPGRWHPWCPKCNVQWPCPQAIHDATVNGDDTE